ncbi:MAG: glycosyltransferase [Burkholderiales bacterium]|nr:MAG: glycosyltransferase [Burkholderiales bacterium]
MKPLTEVIVTTYNNPRALDRVLDSLHRQSTSDFRICVADDGSKEETAQLVNRWQAVFGDRMRHLWHEDKGFRKNLILNTAIKTSLADYLIFLDGDCIARPDFVETHTRRAGTDRFLTGGVIRLNADVTEQVFRDTPASAELFSRSWLQSHGLLGTVSQRVKSGLLPRFAKTLLDRVSPVKRTWNGGNASTFRTNLLKVNGFENDLSYGAEDVELGVRLNNAGIRGESVRYSACALHLEHSRGYMNGDVVASNKRLVAQARSSGKIRSLNGIAEL